MAMMAFVALAGPIARTLSLAPWHVGLAMTVGGLAWITTARWWGRLSDQRGRRTVMLSGLTGFAISYLLLCLFIDTALNTLLPAWVALAGLVLGRGFVGLFYAAVPATSAALVADHVEPEHRAGAMATLGAASGAGMVLGPSLVGLFSPLGLSLPLYITAVLPILAPLGTPCATTHHTARLNDPRLRLPMLVAFSAAIAQVTVGFFALDRLAQEPGAASQTAGIALAIVGITLVLSQSALTKLAWKPTRLIRTGAIVAAIGFGATALASTIWGLWLGFAIAAAGMGWVSPSVSALAANAVEAHEQGVAAGTITAMQGLGVVLGPIAGTLVYSMSVSAPYLMVAALLLAVGLATTATKP